MKRFLLDTNSIIYAINEKIILKKNEYLISFVTELELLSYSKLTTKEEIMIKKLLSNFEIIDINKSIKDITIKI